MTTYAVVYRSGGTHNCHWRRVFGRYTTRESAGMVESIERGGRKALVFTTAQLDAVGLPIGWEPGSVSYDNDHISISAFETHHIKESIPHG